MHEMSIVSRFVGIALKTAEDNHAAKVTKVVLCVGEMTDIVPYYLEKYYPQATESTLLEGSVLEIHVQKLKVECQDCHTIYYPTQTPDRLCPECHSGNCHILEGRDISVEEIVIEEEKEADHA